MTIKEQIAEKKKELKILKNERNTIYEKENEIECDIRELICKWIIDEGILSKDRWGLIRDNGDEYVLRRIRHNVPENEQYDLDDLVEENYHWHFYLDFTDRNDTTFDSEDHEIKLLGDDGDYYLYVKNDPEILQKWIEKLGIAVDTTELENEITEYSSRAKKARKLISSLGGNQVKL